MASKHREKTKSTSDESQLLKRLELLETVVGRLGIGAVLLGDDGRVELQTRQIDRFETILGKGWYQPLIQPPGDASNLFLTDGRGGTHSFETTRQSLFRQEDLVLIRDVTAGARVEWKPDEKESPVSLFMDHLPVAVLIKDEKSRVLYANQYVRENFGETHSHSTDHCKLFSTANKESVAQQGRALTEGRQDLVERLKDRRGKYRTFRTLRFAIPRPDEKSSFLGCIGWDLSDALAASESLAKGRRRYREIFEIAEEGIWLIDADADTVEVNQQMAQMLGYGVEEMREQRLLELMDEQSRADAEMLLERCRSGISDKYDLEFRTKAGRKLWTMVSSAPMYDEAGSYAGVLVMVTDITERKRAEAALKRQRDFAESLIETAPVIVLVLDPDGKIIRFNSFAEKLTGYPLAEVKGKSWFETFVAPDDIPQVVKAFEKARDGDQSQGSTNTISTRDGRERLIAWYVTTLQNAAGGLGSVLAIGHDVTEQKAKDAQLVQAQKMETIGQLTGGIAHDFNNLLTVILGNLELLIRSLGPDADPDMCDLLQDSFSAAQDGAELTKRLLAFSRKAPLQRKRIDLPAFLSHFERFLGRTLPANIAISAEVGTDLDHLSCDPHQLENALLNLALNARDAMPEGGQIRIQARSRQATDLDPTLEHGRYAELAVIDTGTGMTAEQMSHAIEPFYTTKGTKQGTGLGLSMVFGFCDQAGGIFRLASYPEKGARATIILPLDNADAEEDEQMSDSKADTLAGKETVLIVEDDERVRKLAGRYLKDLGYGTLMAENGDRAIEVLRSESAVELVFSDVIMPGEVNGVDLYLWVKGHRPEVKVLLTTGLRSEEINELVGEGGSRIGIGLPKPYTKEQLAETIRQVLAG